MDGFVCLFVCLMGGLGAFVPLTPGVCPSVPAHDDNCTGIVPGTSHGAAGQYCLGCGRGWGCGGAWVGVSGALSTPYGPTMPTAYLSLHRRRQPIVCLSVGSSAANTTHYPYQQTKVGPAGILHRNIPISRAFITATTCWPGRRNPPFLSLQILAQNTPRTVQRIFSCSSGKLGPVIFP